MTIPLAHPVLGEGKVDMKAVEAALASLSYWNKPATAPAPEKTDLSPLEQMYAYYD